jgi:hypothetical protein
MNHYEFSLIDVVIDTNSEDTLNLELGTHPKLNIRFTVHDTTSDPLSLTWRHRPQMAGALDRYDYFMYVEDDMRVPWQALQRWLADSRRLYPLGYLRAFLRTEVNAAGVMVVSDQRRKGRWRRRVRLAAGEVWFRPSNPYHAFWIYSHKQMEKFVASQTWIDGNKADWGTRERAAAGMIWLDGNKHRSLIPLNEKGEICRDATVRHLPNNYAENPNSVFGKLTLSELPNTNIFGKLYRTGLRFLA